VTVAPTDTVVAAVELMRARAVRRLPVVEDGLPVGMVTLGDLAKSENPDSALAEISRAEPDHEGVEPPGTRGAG
jgi:CBS domain-containing protein